MMTWLPYIRQPGEQMFRHVTKNSSLTINARASWANFDIKDERTCISSYMGPAEEMNSSVATRPCQSNWGGMAPCFSCILRHSYLHSVILKLTGQCSKSAFDENYHIEQDSKGYIVFLGFYGTIIMYDEGQKK